MQFTVVLYALSSLASVALATPTTNWQIVLNMGQTPDPGQRVWFYELWHAQGDKTDCVSGYKHVRLISGARTGTKRSPGEDFKGKYNDLVAKQDKEGNFENQPTDSDSGEWKGSLSRVYQWIGTTTMTDSQIKAAVQSYVHAHPKYHMSGPNAANCKTCVVSITHQDITRPAKRMIENVFDEAAEVEAREEFEATFRAPRRGLVA